jgi:ABC-type Fe3+-siderophore transport system permease subunit
MAPVTLNGFLTASMIVFIGFAFFKIFASDTMDKALLEELKSEVGESPKNALLGLFFVKTLDELTPQFTLYKIPFTEKSFFLVNRFPWISWAQILVFAILGYLIHLYQKFFEPLNVLQVLGLLLVCMVASYFIGSIISYIVYYSSAYALGITRAEATTILTEMDNGVKTVFSQMIYFSIFSAILIFKICRRTLADDY